MYRCLKAPNGMISLCYSVPWKGLAGPFFLPLLMSGLPCMIWYHYMLWVELPSTARPSSDLLGPFRRCSPFSLVRWHDPLP